MRDDLVADRHWLDWNRKSCVDWRRKREEAAGLVSRSVRHKQPTGWKCFITPSHPAGPKSLARSPLCPRGSQIRKDGAAFVPRGDIGGKPTRARHTRVRTQRSERLPFPASRIAPDYDNHRHEKPARARLSCEQNSYFGR